MKLLMIGIDGGDQRILEGISLPTFSELFAQLRGHHAHEDLWSRGWAEILSGQHGRDTGAFYSKPLLDGSHRFSQKYGGDDYRADPYIVPLWTRLENAGYRTGFMNFPTTSPAPNVREGFFVAGAGGGSSSSGSANLPSAAVSSTSVATRLEEMSYIADTRFRASGIRETEFFLERLCKMQQRRTDTFIALSREHNVQVGCLVYRSIAIAQYLAMYDLEALLKQGPQSATQHMLVSLYKDFDQQIERLVSELSPDDLVLVSDHGMAPRRHVVHVNPFLADMGMQPQSVHTDSVAPTSSLKRTLKSIIPKDLRKHLRRAAPAVVEGVDGTNWGRIRAFGARYVSGVYVNDKRFRGPVAAEDVAGIVSEIVEAFNSTEVAKAYELHARPYRSLYPNARRADTLPDVWIDHPDSIFFEDHGPLISPNPDWAPLGRSLEHVERDQYTGIKGRTPLLHTEPQYLELVRESDPEDLTLAYSLINRILCQ